MAEWTKYPLDARTQKEIEAFHKKYARKLERMATSLRAEGIVRVHFGLDFNNDEPDLSDYAVIEYTDGRTEELSEWHPMLDQDVLWNFPAGTGAYTFDVTTARVFEDSDGGVMDVEEGLSRAFHSPERRQVLEAEAEEFAAELEAFMDEHADEIEAFVKRLEEEDQQNGKPPRD